VGPVRDSKPGPHTAGVSDWRPRFYEGADAVMFVGGNLLPVAIGRWQWRHDGTTSPTRGQAGPRPINPDLNLNRHTRKVDA